MLTTVAAGRVFDYSHCIGMYSQSGQGFWTPQDFVLGKDGRVYVLSRGVEQLGQRVSKINLDSEFQGQFGSFGGEEGRFIWPRSIDVDQDGRVYVSDEYTNRISVFDAEGAFRYHWGRYGDDDGLLSGPSGIAFDSNNNLWVVDSLNHRVQCFRQQGPFISKFGTQGSDDGELEMPWGLCIDNNQDIYVADWGNNRVQKFSPDGKLLVIFEGTSDGVGSLKGPSGVAVDSEGDVYVTDWGNPRVQIYDASGRFITTLVGDAQEPSPWTQTYIDANPEIIKARRRANMEPEWRFRRPVAINVDADHRIIVLESARHRLQIYNKLKGYEEHSLNL